MKKIIVSLSFVLAAIAIPISSTTADCCMSLDADGYCYRAFNQYYACAAISVQRNCCISGSKSDKY